MSKAPSPQPACARAPETLPALRLAPPADAAGRDSRGSSAPFAAQVFGQPGQRRGLRGGQPVLDEAKSAYLEAEWSGPNDRRAQSGRITKTEI